MTAQRVTTAEAAALLDVPAGQIRAWKHRGDLVPVGLLPGRGKPTPLYVLDEVRVLADCYHQRRRARVKPAASDEPPPRRTRP